jgi:hypothetical protein
MQDHVPGTRRNRFRHSKIYPGYFVLCQSANFFWLELQKILALKTIRIGGKRILIPSTPRPTEGISNTMI